MLRFAVCGVRRRERTNLGFESQQVVENQQGNEARWKQ